LSPASLSCCTTWSKVALIAQRIDRSSHHSRRLTHGWIAQVTTFVNHFRKRSIAIGYENGTLLTCQTGRWIRPSRITHANAELHSPAVGRGGRLERSYFGG